MFLCINPPKGLCIYMCTCVLRLDILNLQTCHLSQNEVINLATRAIIDFSCVLVEEGGIGKKPSSADWAPMSFPMVQCCSLAFKGRLYWHQTSGKWIWPQRKKAPHLSRWYGKERHADASHICVICVLRGQNKDLMYRYNQQG